MLSAEKRLRMTRFLLTTRIGRRGVTITELMVAVAILSIGILGLFGTFRYINQAIHIARGQTLATNLAQERIESLKNLTYYGLLVTTAAATDNTVDPAVTYDTANYPPETIAIGGMTFTRYTYVTMVQVSSDVISAVSSNYPDTGMKQITVSIVWKNGADKKEWTLNNLLENPYVDPLDAEISGYAASTTGATLAGVSVSVPQYPDYQTVTDSAGDYTLRVHHGHYAVSASTPGYYAWTSAAFDVPSGGTKTVDIPLTPIASGTVTGEAWYSPGLLISQVVASTVEANGFDAEYVELFNPTTSEIDIADSGGSALMHLNYGSGFGDYCDDVKLVYVSTYVASDHYYLIASTPSLTLNGAGYAADAYYSASNAHTYCNPWNGDYWNGTSGYDLILNDHSGLVWVTDGGGATVDAVGWTLSGHAPDGCGGHCSQTCEGTCIPFASGSLPQGEQAVRLSSPAATLDAAAMTAYGRSYDSGNNEVDFFYPSASSSFGIQFPPRDTASGAFTPITGVPAVGALVAADDYTSGSTAAYSASVSSGSLSLPYAPFSLVGVATGTWQMAVATAGYAAYFAGVDVPSQNSLVGVPNAATTPSWTGAGLYHVQLTTFTYDGYVRGLVQDVNGSPLSGIQIQAGGITKTTGSNGLYFLPVSSGTQVIVANSNNANPLYVGQTYTETIVTGQLTTQDVVLSQGGTLTGYMTTGTTPVPNVTVSATLGGSQRGAGVTDTSGMFSIPNLTTGTYVVTPQLDVGQNASPQSLPGTVTPSATVDVGTFTIAGALGGIAGTIMDNGSLVTSGALLIASTSTIPSSPPTIYGSSAPAMAPLYSVTSAADGSYDLPVRGGSVYYLSVYVPTLNSDDTITVTTKTYSGITVSPGTDTTWPVTLP
ncbi:MAG: carboxypeptidase regulatory-like domain-containing protein [Elusimicrobia bacterium]|nr:carboxypeptidase regulatory-like domain-containing protein [Elusimicrobiota bacterium]